MRYRLPVGTPVEVRKRSEKQFRRHVMRRELVFDRPQTVAYGGRVLYFECQGWLISVRADRVDDRGQRD